MEIGRQPLIAVVDDEKMLLHVFSSLMKQFNYRAHFFADAHKAFEAIAAQPEQYNLLILDIRMPGMDGITFAKKIRMLLPKLPVIFMTGHSSDGVKEEALSLGNVVFLEKPFPLEQTLRDTIARLVDSKEEQS
jgi:CheY-like chemotaxis protein